MLKRQRHLDQAGDAGRGLEVADIGFDRAQGARASWRTVDGKHRAQGVDLDRIALKVYQCHGPQRIEPGRARLRRAGRLLAGQPPGHKGLGAISPLLRPS